MTLRPFALLTLFALSGCAAIFNRSTATISVNSTPPGAAVEVDGAPSGMTPTAVQVNNHKGHNIVVSGPGIASATCHINSSMGAGWVILDFLAGIVPLVVDAITNAWNSVDSDQCNFALQGAPMAPAQPSQIIIVPQSSAVIAPPTPAH